MKKTNSVLLSTPYLLWMAAFTLVPLGVVGYYALTDPSTGVFTLGQCEKSGHVPAGAVEIHCLFLCLG